MKLGQKGLYVSFTYEGHQREVDLDLHSNWTPWIFGPSFFPPSHKFNLMEFYFANRIVHHHLRIETSQLNGVVEKKHQHLSMVTKFIIFNPNYPQNYEVMLF